MTLPTEPSTDPGKPAGIGAPPASYLTALRTLLRPLVRGLIAHGVGLPRLVDLLKGIYVEVASDELRRQGETSTQSAISVATGVHRKDVKRLQELPQVETAAPGNLSLGSRLIGVWVGSAQFLDEENRPRALHRRRSDGAPSFDELVESVSTDVRPKTILDEWTRLGVVTVTADGFVRLDTSAFVPRQGYDAIAYYYGRNLRDHIAAGTHNLRGGDPPFLDRAVFYGGLEVASIATLSRLARELGGEALEKVNREALRLSQKDDEVGGGGQRMTFGVYFYAQDQDEPDAPADDATRTGGGS